MSIEDVIEHFSQAMRRSPPYAPAWYYYMGVRAEAVRQWRETHTLTSVK